MSFLHNLYSKCQQIVKLKKTPNLVLLLFWHLCNTQQCCCWKTLVLREHSSPWNPDGYEAKGGFAVGPNEAVSCVCLQLQGCQHRDGWYCLGNRFNYRLDATFSFYHMCVFVCLFDAKWNIVSHQCLLFLLNAISWDMSFMSSQHFPVTILTLMPIW